MRSLLSAALLVAACAGTPRSDYVPGGEGLTPEARASYRRAVERERHGDPDEALEILDELCSGHPLRLGLHLYRLRLARRHRGAEYASGLYEPAPPGVDAERAGILATLARTKPGDLAARKDVLDFAAQREPGEAFWRLGIAEVGIAAHDAIVERAERERELGRVQTSAESLVEADSVLETARQDTETAGGYDEGLAEVELLLGFVASRQADRAPEVEVRETLRRQADYHYRRALERDPASLTARLNLAENHIYFRDFSAARRELRKAALLAPAEPLVWNNLGYTYHATGPLSRAVSCYREALRLEPASARTRTALADCLRGVGDTERAVGELRRARRDAVGDRELLAEIAFKLAAIHEHEGRYRAAVLEYERHLELGGKESAKARSRIRHIYERAFE